ncbi:MAG TPA: carbon-nitrogen hydrolase [Bacteroidales bacterium]|nr:carbon-nitrogen hydrolase [Bacteroidales bacterium]HBZ65387.1 carbon-nitrogen hydrolase [Bacteroidales bacterium]
MENLKLSGVDTQMPVVALVQFAPLLGNIEANISRIGLLLNKVKADVVVLPELASSGYAFSDRNEAFQCAETVYDSVYIRFLTSRAADGNYFIVSGFNERDGDRLFNTAILVGPSGFIGKYRKMHLFWNEADLFEPGDTGLPVFEIAGIKLGMLVCFDWMFPEVWRILALKGVDLVAHPSNLVLPFCQQAVAVHALCNRFYVATANRIGSERDLHFTGGSVLVSPLGETLVKGPLEDPFVGNQAIDLTFSRNKNITPRNTLKESRRPECYTFLTSEKKN